MAAVTVAAVGVGASAYSASRSRSAGRDAQRAQQDAMDQQVQLGREQLEFGQQQYRDWQDRFNPVLDDLTLMAYEDREPDYAAISADVATAHDTSQDINRRTMQRYGIRPSDGAAQQSELSYGLGRALSTADAHNRARMAHGDQQFGRLASIYGLGSGQGAQAQSMINAAYSGLGGAYGQHAGAFGQQAMYHAGQANQALGDMAGWAGWGIGQMGGSSTVRPATPTYQPGPGAGQRPPLMGWNG